MFLEKLTIQGFKSFANPVELVFTRELTAIVGPNGSGKSNIADSVRWVLGEQSPKLLRGKKADDVIFSGSEKKSRLSFAQVDLHLDNSDGQAPIDYKKIVVSRKIYRNGESEYLLNNTKVRLADIQILLAKSHFGQKTYSVIGQGTIDRILTFTSAERKDFFDEATGVKQFQMKKDQAVHKLHQTHENLAQAENVLNEILPRLRSLKRQVNRLEAKEKLETELRQLQTEYYSFQKHSLQTDIESIEKKQTFQQDKISAIQKQLSDLQGKLESQNALTSRSSEFELLQRKLAAAQDEYNLLSREKTRLEGARDVELMQAGQSDVVWLQSRHDTLSAKENRLTIEVNETEQTARHSQTAVKEAEKKLHLLENEIKQTEDTWQQAEKPNADRGHLEKIAQALHSEHTSLDARLDEITNLEQLATYKDKLRSFGKKLREFFGLLQTPQQEERHDIVKKLRELLADKDTQRNSLQKLHIQLQLAEQQITTLKKELADIATEKQRLSEEISSVGAGSKTSAPARLESLNKDLQDKAATIMKLNQELSQFNEKEEGKKKEILDWQKDYSRLQYDQSILTNDLNKLNIEMARLETRAEDLDVEIQDEFPEFILSKVGSIALDSHKLKIQDIKKQLGIIGGIDDTTLTEYNEVKERSEFLEHQTKDLNEAMNSLKKLIKELDDTIAKEFNKSFKNINELFGKYFKKLFSGGSAKLILEMKEPDDETVEDIDPEERELEEETDGKLKFESLNYSVEIMATPPGKKLSGVSMLSGGEKALTSIALISAIIATNPSPFVVLDEVDAALDEANSVRFAEIVDELSDKTQFITISHNRATMHQAKILYGVTMHEGVSHLLSVNFEEADKIAA